MLISCLKARFHNSIMQRSKKTKEIIYAKVKHTQNTFGSSVVVYITEFGKVNYPDIAKYQLFDNEKALSPRVRIGEKTTVYPAKFPGDTLKVILSDIYNEKIREVSVTLMDS